MHQTIHETIDVIAIFPRSSSKVLPKRIKWQGKEYDVTELGMHYPQRIGRVMHHIFSVTAGNLFFRLNLNTETLQWIIEEISDGLSD